MSFFKIEHCFFPFTFLFLLLGYFAGSDYPRVWPDEVLFYSPAYELFRFDILRTPVLEGLIPGMATHTLWMPPTFMIFVSWVLQFVSEDIEIVRMFTSIIGVVSIYFFSRVAKEMGLSPKRILVLQILLFSDFLLFKVSHSVRMESLCFAFISISIYLLFYKKTDGRNVSRIRSAFSGVFFGLSLVTHPFALSYAPIFLLILVFRKQLDKNITWFILGTLVPIGFWMSYALPNFEIFSIQFGAQLGRKKELLTVFTIINKFKIIFSEFKFPWIKIISTSLAFIFVFFTFLKTNWKMEFLEKEFPIFTFSVLYTINIFLFLLLSSEYWYVYHLVFPLALLLVSFNIDSKYDLSPAFIHIGYNLFIMTFFIGYNLIFMNMNSLTNTYYKSLESLIGNHKKIYLQAIPDPYFYFKKNRPDLEVLEFIPGELPINPDYYKETMTGRDVYVFYNKELMNPVLKEFFQKNPNLFREEEVIIETPRKADLELKAYLYIKNLPN